MSAKLQRTVTANYAGKSRRKLMLLSRKRSAEAETTSMAALLANHRCHETITRPVTFAMNLTPFWHRPAPFAGPRPQP